MAKWILEIFSLEISRKSELIILRRSVRQGELLKSKLDLIGAVIRELDFDVSPRLVMESAILSNSQIGQDLFVLSQLKFKENGYFIEFGAADGVESSNSFLLEKRFNWNGILVEPGRSWQTSLKKNRSANIDFSYIWKVSGVDLEFKETSNLGLSTLVNFLDSDMHSEARGVVKHYKVHALSLNDLLVKYSAPHEIDYLSIDTEGSEFDILNALDFNKWKFRVITCEHNYTPSRAKIEKLLTENGYRRILTEFSKFDDWYIYDSERTQTSSSGAGVES